MTRLKSYYFREEGNQDPGKTPGDIKIVLEQKDHNYLRRAGDDIFVSKKITLAESLTGMEFSFMHLDKRPILVKSPEKQVIDNNSSLVIKGEGMPLAGNPFTKGDLVIEFNVIFPKYSDLSDIETLNKCLGKKPLKNIRKILIHIPLKIQPRNLKMPQGKDNKLREVCMTVMTLIMRMDLMFNNVSNNKIIHL